MGKIAILGYGTVGSGVYEIFENGSFLKKAGEEIEVKRVLDIRDFPNHSRPEIFTKDFDDVLADDEITVVAETMGGLHPAYEFTKKLLQAGKSVTTSNKELVATYGPELLKIAEEKGVSYMFEASVGGGIPIIRPLSSCLLANNIERIAGILNGTTNFILSQMIDNGSEFETALAEAQRRGYAERNPAADIEGHDACRKIAILSSVATGEFVDYNDIETEGITNVSLNDVKLAEKLGCAIKLIGYSQMTEDGIYACVAPMLVKTAIPLSSVKDVFNAITVRGDYLGDAMFYGRGAGKDATASAVAADVIDIVKNQSKRMLAWEGKARVTSDKKWQYFLRISEADIKAAEELFGKLDYVSDGSEVGFITEAISKEEIQSAAEKLGVGYIKVLDE